MAWFGHAGPFRHDGLATYSREITDGLRQRSHRVIFFYHHAPYSQHTVASEQVRLGALRVQRHDIIPARGARALAGRLAAAADVVHASLSFSLLDRWLAAGAGRVGRPTVATWHAPFDEGSGLEARLMRLWHWLYGWWVLRHFGRVILFTEAHARWMVARGVLAASQVVVIPNAVDTDFWRPELPRAGRTGGTVLFAGRLDADKRPELLCRAWQLAQPPPEWRLRLVGSGGLDQTLQRRWGGDPQIVFVGPLMGREAMRAELQAADIFVLPSAYEAQSLALLEAMACGCACITMAGGGVAAALGGAGLCLPAGSDAHALAEALTQLIDDVDRRVAWGAAAPKRVAGHFALSRALTNLTDLYISLGTRTAFL